MGVVEAVMSVGVGFLGGAHFAGGITSIVILFVGTMLLGTAFASFSNTLALLLRKQESVIAANVTLVLNTSHLRTYHRKFHLERIKRVDRIEKLILRIKARRWTHL